MTATSESGTRKRGGAKYLSTYVVTLLLGAAALLFAISHGERTSPAPQAPAFGAVSDPAAACLGERVGTVQSGVFLNLHQVGSSSAHLGELIASTRLDGGAGTGSFTGRCPAGADLAGDPFQLDLTVDEQDESLTGTAVLAGEEVPVTITGVAVAASTASDDEPPLTGSELSGRIFLAVAIVIIAARGAGLLFARIRQPRVVGEIVAGIVLGPSVVGAYFPEVTNYLFPAEVTSILRALANLGLIFFMFLIGLELDHRLMRGSGRTALLVSHVSIVVPFALGLLLAVSLYPLLGSGDFLGFGLFLGAAMAITAFPVLARILTDTGIHRTRLGALAITCAAVGDLTAWCILAVVVGIVTSAGAGSALVTIGLSAVFVVVMLFGVRPLIARLADVHEARGRLSPPVMAALLIALLLASWMTEEIGIHAIFGAFLLGAVMPRSPRLTAEITEKLEDVTVLLLLPIFFAVMGLSTRFDLLDRPELWLAAALVLAVAVLGKWGGSMIAARVTGQGWRHSAALGILMNARGLTEIVILTIGRDLGIISPAMFTIMVLMALITTFMATPLLSLVYPRRVIDWELYRDNAVGRPSPRADVHRVVVAIDGSESDRQLLDLAVALRGPAGQQPEIVLAQVVPPPGREEVRGRLGALDEAVAHAIARLEPTRARLAAMDLNVRVRAVTGVDVGAEVARIAVDEGSDIVLLGWHRAYLGRSVLKGVPGHLLQNGVQDVAVLVDDDGRTARAAGPVGVWYNGAVTGGAALEVAAGLARGLGTSLRVAHGVNIAPVDIADADLVVEWIPFPSLDVERIQAALGDARLIVTGDIQRTTLRTSPRERLIRSMPCPVLVVRGAQHAAEPPTEPLAVGSGAHAPVVS